MYTITYCNYSLDVYENNTQVHTLKVHDRHNKPSQIIQNIQDTEKFLDKIEIIAENEAARNAVAEAWSWYYFHYPVVLNEESIAKYSDKTFPPSGWTFTEINDKKVLVPKNMYSFSYECRNYNLYACTRNTKCMTSSGRIAHYPNYEAYLKGQIKPFYADTFYLDINAKGWVFVPSHYDKKRTWENLEIAPFEVEELQQN